IFCIPESEGSFLIASNFGASALRIGSTSTSCCGVSFSWCAKAIAFSSPAGFWAGAVGARIRKPMRQAADVSSMNGFFIAARCSGEPTLAMGPKSYEEERSSPDPRRDFVFQRINATTIYLHRPRPPSDSQTERITARADRRSLHATRPATKSAHHDVDGAALIELRPIVSSAGEEAVVSAVENGAISRRHDTNIAIGIAGSIGAPRDRDPVRNRDGNAVRAGDCNPVGFIVSRICAGDGG